MRIRFSSLSLVPCQPVNLPLVDSSTRPLSYKNLLLRPEPFRHFRAEHADEAERDEGQAEQLAHVEEHRGFELFLYVLGELDEEAGGEYQCDAEAEEEACADALRLLAVEVPADEEEQGVGYGLVELSGVARKQVHALEDERPGHVGGLAYYLGVHQVAQAYEAGRDGSGDGHVVEHAPEVDFRAADVQPEGYD